jgi:hypothetical protein
MVLSSLRFIHSLHSHFYRIPQSANLTSSLLLSRLLVERPRQWLHCIGLGKYPVLGSIRAWGSGGPLEGMYHGPSTTLYEDMGRGHCVTAVWKGLVKREESSFWWDRREALQGWPVSEMLSVIIMLNCSKKPHLFMRIWKVRGVDMPSVLDSHSSWAVWGPAST